VSKAEGPIASFRSSGGTNWPGGSFDPETHIAYIPSFTSFPILGLLPPPSKEFSDLPYVSGNALTGVRYISGPGANAGADAPARDDRREPSSRRDAARVRQGEWERSRRGLQAGAAVGDADDLRAQWQAVHRRRRQRRQLFGRISRVRAWEAVMKNILLGLAAA